MCVFNVCSFEPSGAKWHLQPLTLTRSLDAPPNMPWNDYNQNFVWCLPIAMSDKPWRTHKCRFTFWSSNSGGGCGAHRLLTLIMHLIWWLMSISMAYAWMLQCARHQTKAKFWSLAVGHSRQHRAAVLFGICLLSLDAAPLSDQSLLVARFYWQFRIVWVSYNWRTWNTYESRMILIAGGVTLPHFSSGPLWSALEMSLTNVKLKAFKF